MLRRKTKQGWKSMFLCANKFIFRCDLIFYRFYSCNKCIFVSSFFCGRAAKTNFGKALQKQLRRSRNKTVRTYTHFDTTPRWNFEFHSKAYLCEIKLVQLVYHEIHVRKRKLHVCRTSQLVWWRGIPLLRPTDDVISLQRRKIGGNSQFVQIFQSL